jgi:DNA gyrase/topoisomerase IV subunit A
MAVNYKTPGTKEYKKINYLKSLMIDPDPNTRKQALLLYNKITTTEYDKLIQDLEEQLEKIEKVLRQVEKRKLKEAILSEESGEEVDRQKFPDKEDKNVSQELSGIRFKLKYYTELKEYEIDTRIGKTKIKL